MPQVPEGLREFFGDQFGQGRRGRQVPERRQGGLGSGVIVRPDGYILTNHHVVDGAEQVNVELTDGRSFKAKVVGSDQPSDLAVLKIDGHQPADAVARQTPTRWRVGDVVLAVGNPLGVGQTVTMGIVSAKGRATTGGDAASRTSSRPTRRSTRATPAARWSAPAASWSASTRRSSRRRAATSASASRFPRTWRATS